LKFAQQSTFKVLAHVEKPGGGHHGKAFEEEVTSGAGSVVAVGIIAVTKKS
jgi:hypothetical protein